MKRIYRAYFVCFCGIILSGITPNATASGEPKLSEKWKTTKELDVPECVILNSSENMLYVSNVAGKPAEKNGAGFISKVSLEGKIEKLKWATGLNAPKGMAIHGAHLYVSDIDELVRIDLADGSVSARYPAAGAVFLNDAAADAQGNIYVGDSSAENSIIYKLSNGTLTVWMKDPQIRNPNGLLMQGNRFLVGNGQDGNLNSIDLENKTITLLAKTGSGIDGLKSVGNEQYATSDWAGKISLVNVSSGETVVLQNTTDAHINAADFEYIADRKLLLVPTFFDNRVTAYRVETSANDVPKAAHTAPLSEAPD